MKIRRFLTKLYYQILSRSFRLWFAFIQLFFRHPKSVLLWDPQADFPGDSPLERLRFFAPQALAIVLNPHSLGGVSNALWLMLWPNFILISQIDRAWLRAVLKFRPLTFGVDPLRNPMDGWEWARLACAIENINIRRDGQQHQQKLAKLFAGWRKNLNLDRVYLFGTGPSLEKANERDWSDGYRVVCNTIVRDPELFHKLAPQIIVAGDGIYHFGHTDFAKAFRSDLKKRLSESECIFLFPRLFLPVVQRELGEFSDRLFPVPVAESQSVHHGLDQNYFLPALGNALALLLLPVGCTFSKNVCLWGFDGRAPDDKLFWSNSVRHSYPELMSGLLTNHPIFFDHHVPKTDPFKYMRNTLGDELEQAFLAAERAGWKFSMLHQSWTPSLARRKVTEPTKSEQSANRAASK